MLRVVAAIYHRQCRHNVDASARFFIPSPISFYSNRLISTPCYSHPALSCTSMKNDFGESDIG